MKAKYFIIILLNINFFSILYSQTFNNKTVIMMTDSTKNHFYKQFKLTNKDNIVYAIEMYEDSVSYLLKKDNNKWIIIDTLTNHTSFGTYNDTPRIEITDFNFDSYTDLTITLLTNVNGNQWGKIFLFNPMTQQLQVISSAEDTNLYWTDGIWAAPEYNSEDSIIICKQLSGNTGMTYISRYKLIGMNAIPIEKELTDYTKAKIKNNKMTGIIERSFIGVNGIWMLIEEN